MPRGDRTGPVGNGSMRGLGAGLGCGNGRGRGMSGRFSGQERHFAWIDEDGDKQELRHQVETMQRELERIRNRLADCEDNKD